MTLNTDRVDIFANGDVTLICAPSKNFQPYRFRVASKILAMASPVVEAMLSPRFLEGKTLALDKFVEISLPDDDSGAMYYI